MQQRLIWVELVHGRVLNILHNHRYAGAYVYGRTRQKKLGNQVSFRRVPREQWKVFLPEAHPGYLSWQDYEVNPTKLLENANGYGLDRRKSCPREGAALLQGVVVCGVCGLRMTVRYHVRQGHPVPDYVCQRKGIETARTACQHIPGSGLDQAVAEVLLEAVTPAVLEVALEVFEELKRHQVELARQRRRQVERARQEAESAQRQYLLVRPENRLVADALELQWNEKLSHLARLEEEYALSGKADRLELNPQDREQILALAADLPRVWKDPRTSARDRKRMLRLLVEDVTLIRDQRQLHIAIRWKGGATTELDRPVPLAAGERFRTPADIVEQVRALATEQTDKEIARTLNGRWLRSGRGNKFTRMSVKTIRRAYQIDSLFDHWRKQGWLTSKEAAAQAGIHYQTAKHYATIGALEARRVDDRDQMLFAPNISPLLTQVRLNDSPRYPPCTSKRSNEVQYAS